MIITGTVVAIDMNATMKKKGGGTYDGVELTFKDGNGKTQTKGFHVKTFDFNTELKSELSSLNVKDEFTAEIEKDGDFWNWKKVTKGAAPQADTGTKYVKKENSYPTTDERAKTQEYIVKQSSITAALKFLELSKQEVNDDTVLKKADMFFNYVMGTNNSDDFPL